MNTKSFIKNQKGSISVIGTILILIIFTVMTGYMSLNKSSWTSTELQSIIDISSLNALNESINEAKLKDEIFAVKGTNAYIDTKQSPMKVVYDDYNLNIVLKNNFQKQLNKQISKNDMIDSIEVKDVTGTLSASGWGTNGSSVKKTKPQLSLDAMIQVVIKNDTNFNNLGAYNINYKDAKTGNIISVKVKGVTESGQVVLTVRSLSRVVYR